MRRTFQYTAPPHDAQHYAPHSTTARHHHIAPPHAPPHSTTARHHRTAQVCVANGITKKGEKLVCPIDDNGRFTDEVPDFVGVAVKDADKDIIARLKGEVRLQHPAPPTQHA